MRVYILAGKKVRLYDSIDELPIENFQKYNKYVLLDSGIGSDVNDVCEHIANAYRLIEAGHPDKAKQELQNLNQNIGLVVSEVSPRFMAFAALIQSIDGVEQTDLSDEHLREIIADLRRERKSVIEAILDFVKKKLRSELETYFPQEFVTPRTKEGYDIIKKRTLLVLEAIAAGTDNNDKIGEIDRAQFEKYRPSTYIGPDSVEVQVDKQYETTCLVVSQKTTLRAKDMTVLEYYNALSTIEKQIEAETKVAKPRHK